MLAPACFEKKFKKNRIIFYAAFKFLEFSQSKYIQPINDRHDAIRTAFKALFTLRFTHIFHEVILTEDFEKYDINLPIATPVV
jgi:hypothetical protein